MKSVDLICILILSLQICNSLPIQNLKDEMKWQSENKNLEGEQRPRQAEGAAKNSLPIALEAMGAVVSENSKKAEEEREEMQNRVSQGINNAPSPEELFAELENQDISDGQEKDISIETESGFNKLSGYRPSSFRISENLVSSKKAPNSESKNKHPQVYNYPHGQGPLMMNGCYGNAYNDTDPCAGARIPADACSNMITAAAFIGVGFDGRGGYNAQSRKMSIIQRKCNNKNTFMNYQLPDVMKAFGIYNLNSETKSFSSASDYVKFLVDKSQTSSQRGMFEQERSQVGSGSSFAGDLGTIGQIAGAGIEAYQSGSTPDLTSASAQMGKQIGEKFAASSSNKDASANGNGKQEKESSSKSSESSSQESNKVNSFFAILFIDITLYEITIDRVTPDSLSESFLKDYLNLPDSYFGPGAQAQYQKFILRYGSHYVHSAEFGGQLKIVKTMKSEKKMKSEEFSEVSEKEFKAVTNSLESESSEKSSSVKVMGIGSDSNEKKSKQKSKKEQTSNSESSQSNKGSNEGKESEFTETTVQAQGGDPIIAKALFDFYNPEFTSLFGDWITSIPNYIKPFEFQLREIQSLLNINMDKLFPGGNVDYGCMSQDPALAENLIKDNVTGKYFYMRYDIVPMENHTLLYPKRVYCKFESLEKFKEKMQRKLNSLERAIAVYMTEGATPTTSFDIPAGKPGCETDTLEYIGLGKKNGSKYPSYLTLKSQKFKVQFSMPMDISNLIMKDETLHVVYQGNKWYTQIPGENKINVLAGCKIPETGSLSHPVCIRGVLFTYDLAGFLIMKKKDYKINAQVIPGLNKIFVDYPAAKVSELSFHDSQETKETEKPGAIPCNVFWTNTHIVDTTKNHVCINFLAATDGDIFVIFAAIPKMQATWYYIQINFEGVSIYRGLKMEYSRTEPGIGSLGDANLYESYFVCLNYLENNDIVMQYGKSPPAADVGIVLASNHFFTGGSKHLLRFYSFGTGDKEVNFLNVQVVHRQKKVMCDLLWVLVNGSCRRDCHVECKTRGDCTIEKDDTACIECKNYRISNGTNVRCVEKCPPGYSISKNDKKLCILCPKGKFKSSFGETPCLFCSPGYQNHIIGAHFCVACEPGYFAPKNGSLKCNPCPVGSHSSIKGSPHCKKCKRGQFNDITGAKTCKKCLPGTFTSEKASIICDKCETGTYNDKSGEKGCTKCPPRYEQFHQGQTSCDLCDPGYFSSSPGSVSCQPCSVGSYQNEEGMISCKLCSSTKKSISIGAVSCSSNCPAGSYSPSLNNNCSYCAPGTYQKGVGAPSCRKCKLGSYQPLQGRTSCVKALPGTYVDQLGATDAKICPKGTSNNKEGSISLKSCIECESGSFTNEEGSTGCTLCPPGQFQRRKGQTACKTCPKAFFSSKPGSISCSRCKEGSINDKTGVSECTICEPGTISVDAVICKECGVGKFSMKSKKSDVGHTICVLCPQGFYSNIPKLGVMCSKCPSGWYSNRRGSTKCIECKPGTKLVNSKTGCEKCKIGEYQSKSAQRRCIFCDKGHYSKAGAKICNKCPKGYFQSDRGQGKCIICGKGRYSSKEGNKICPPCEPGTYANITGSFKCVNCDEGYYQYKKGQTGCFICQPGSYSKTGSANCTLCEKGTFQKLPGQNHCKKCTPGTFSDKEGMTFCKACPANTYQNLEKQSKCRPCDQNTRSKRGSSHCTACKAGFEIGKVTFDGEAGSNVPSEYMHTPECAFTGKNCPTVSSKYEFLPGSFLKPKGYSSFNKRVLSLEDRAERAELEEDILSRRLKYWESSGINYFWPKILFFKFKKPQVITSFVIETVEGKAPRQKLHYYFWGSNKSNCMDLDAPSLYYATFTEKLASFKNDKSFYCYGFRFEKSPEKTAAIRYPIKFYRNVVEDGKFVEQCKLCSEGEYQPEENGIACLFCDPGKYTEKKGSKSCTKTCSRGKMANDVFKATGCLACLPGSYNDEAGKTTCWACEPGTRSLNKGSTKCEKCPRNWFIDMPGQQHCAACATGCTSFTGDSKCTGPKSGDLTSCVSKYIDVQGSEDYSGGGNEKTLFKMAWSYQGPGWWSSDTEYNRLWYLPYWSGGWAWAERVNPYVFPRKPDTD